MADPATSAEAKVSSSSNKSGPLRIGVLCLSPVQLLDVSPVDLFGMLSTEYLEACNLPSPITKLGIDVDIQYITPSAAEDEKGSSSATAPPSAPSSSSVLPSISGTANITLHATATLSSPHVAPGMLDILMIPGPPPDAVPSVAACAFIKAQAASPHTDVLIVCTGVFPAGHAGILDGRTLTAPRALVPRCRRLFPHARFDDAVRWAHDGNVWASGGITNAQDMVAQYLRERYPAPLANAVCALADVGGRDRLYDSRVATDVGWWVLQVFRSLWTRRRAK